MAGSRVSLEELVVAGRELFGPGFSADRAGWREDLKAAYRRRALETHPDRARAMGRSEVDLAREFERVSRAYRVLSAWNRPASAPRAPPSWVSAAQRRAAGAAHAGPGRVSPAAGAWETDTAPGRSPGAHTRAAAPSRPVRPATAPPDPSTDPQASALPRRKLRLAEYLYYSGRISWSALTDAVAWQRKQRPAIGRLAVSAGYLTVEQVARLLDRRRAAGEQGVPLGEYAVRHGVLTQFQRLALLGRQIRLQRRIGEYFVEQGLVDRDELDELRRRIAWHNARQGAGAEP